MIRALIHYFDDNDIVIELPEDDSYVYHSSELGTFLVDNTGEFFELEEGFESVLSTKKFKDVVVGGKKIRKLQCKDGYRAVGGFCVRMTPKQLAALRKNGKKLGKIQSRLGALKSVKLKKNRSLRIRDKLHF